MSVFTRSSAALALFDVPDDVKNIFARTHSTLPTSRDHLLDLCFGDSGRSEFDVAYDIEGADRIVEAQVTRCKNGVSVNYPDPYMRRRIYGSG